jgi:hypothetical protein
MVARRVEKRSSANVTKRNAAPQTAVLYVFSAVFFSFETGISACCLIEGRQILLEKDYEKLDVKDPQTGFWLH